MVPMLDMKLEQPYAKFAFWNSDLQLCVYIYIYKTLYVDREGFYMVWSKLWANKIRISIFLYANIINMFIFVYLILDSYFTYF